MWIVDSSVWIDYFGGTVTPQTDLLHAALGQRAVALGDIILCEVLQGYRRQQDFEAARQALLQFPIYTIGGTEMALQSAENYRILRRQGVSNELLRLFCEFLLLYLSRGVAQRQKSRFPIRNIVIFEEAQQLVPEVLTKQTLVDGTAPEELIGTLG